MLQLAEIDTTAARLEQTLSDRASLVAGAASDLISISKAVAGKCPDPSLQSQLITVAKAVGIASTQIVASVSMISPVLVLSACVDRLADVAAQCRRTADVLASVCKAAQSDETLLRQSQEGTVALQAVLASLVEKAKEAPQQVNPVSEACRVVYAACGRLNLALADTPELVRVIKDIGQAANQIVNALKERAAKTEHTKMQQQLTKSCRCLADAIAKMVELAKVAAKAPNDETVLSALCDSADLVKTESEEAAKALLG